MAAIQTAIELNDQFTSVLYGIMDAVNLATAQMYDMQQAMSMDIDTSSLDGAREAIDEATASLIALNSAAQQPASAPNPLVGSSAPVEIPVQWETDSLDVFTGTGIDRFEQEVQSTNSMLEQLSSTQNDIASQAYSTTIFPPEMFQDLNSMAVRIDSIRERIQQIESNPVNMGTDTANSQLEQLRSQLDRAIQEQNNLNTAMQNMDVSGANAAYLQLSQTVGNTERYIRDNTDEQGRFNQEIQEGVSGAEGLMGMIKRMVGAYVGIQSVGKILNMSDELTQTTSRLDLMNNSFNEINGTANETSELVNMVYAAAQDARGSLDSMASVVARFGNNARDAFGNSEEVVAFADLVQKQMAIAGASTQEAANAELQLSQALGSGVLRGDELNSIFEQAPNLIQNIADYLDVPIGQIREMAADGELSADVVKAAIFAAADDINGKFDEMPMTWGQIWQSMQNTAVMAFQPVLQRLNGMANSDAFQGFVDGAIEAMATTANMVLNIFDLVGSVAGFVADNWSMISPIVYGIAAALAVYGTYLTITKGMEIACTVTKTVMTIATYAHAAATRTAVNATTAETAAQLAADGVVNPTYYWRSRGTSRGGSKSTVEPTKWGHTTVKKILTLQEYCGDVINFKSYSKSYKMKKRIENPEENRAIFLNVHEAIIDRQTWEKVQALQKGTRRKKPTVTQEPSVFSGLLKCPECGGNLNFHFNQNNHDIKFFSCQNHNSGYRKCSKTHYIRLDFLEQVVLYEVKRLACFASEYENDFIKAMIGRSAKVAENTALRKQRELDALTARDRELDMLFERLYEDNVAGKIDDARFAKMSKRYEQEQGENAKKIKALRLELKKDESKRMDIDDFLETVRRYTDAATITKRMVAELIDHIEVYHAEKQDGITNQRVVIHYNCIGAFDVPDRRKIPEADIIMETRKGVALSYAPEQVAV